MRNIISVQNYIKICIYAKKIVLLPKISIKMEHISKAQVKLIRSLQQKKYRDELGLFVAEGEKCIEELRKAFELELMVRNQESGVRNQESGVRSQDNCLVASQTEIEQMSGLRTPQGVIAVFRKPEA